MAKWEDKIKQYPWNKDSRAKTLGCTIEGTTPKTAVTGWPINKRSMLDSIIVMLRCLNGGTLTQDISKVLEDAGASLAGVSQSSLAQTGLRDMMRQIDSRQYANVQFQFLEICKKYSEY